MTHTSRISSPIVSLLGTAVLVACGGGNDASIGSSAADAAAATGDTGRMTAASASVNPLALVSPAAPSAAPDSTWILVGSYEGQTFTINGTNQVRYGAGSGWVEATVSGTAQCQNSFFGVDPAKGLSKKCYAAPAAPASPAPSATGYYVDSVAGNDSWPGTSSQPWKTLAKLSTASLKTGAGFYLKCGSMWRESLNLTTTQLVDGAIIAGYGPACSTSKAVISGADDFSSGWTKSGNIWSKAVPTTTPKIVRLFVNGVSQRTAQWPNNAGPGHEYAIADASSPSSTTSLVANTSDAAALTGQDLNGATIQVRVNSWQVNPGTVSSFNASTRTFTVSSPTPATMLAGDGYVLQDKKWMLDAPGEFYHDTANGVLYLYPSDTTAQGNLNATLVEGSVRTNAMKVSTRANLAISNLGFAMAQTDALVLYQAPNAVVSNVDASHNGRSGIQVALSTAPVAPARGATIKNSTLSDNSRLGVDASNALNVSVLSNTVTDTGTIGYAGATSAAISAGDGGIVDRNTVNGAAYHGIQFSGTGGSQITNNTIQSYCLRLTDCGGIYTWNAANVSSQRKTNQLATVSGNRVMGATPNTQGAVGGGFDVLGGVYLDNFVTNATLQNNMLTGMPIGILVHNSSNNVISSNTVWFTTKTGIWATMDQTTGNYMTGNVFKSNQLVPATTVSGVWPALPQLGSSYAVTYQDVINGAASLTSGTNLFTQNQMVQLNGVAGAVAYVLSNTSAQILTYAGWHSLNPGEAPLSVPASYAAYNTTDGPELMTNGGFDSGISPWASWFWSGAVGGSVQSVSGVAGCSGNCARFTAASTYDQFYSPGFTMVPNVPNVLRFKASFGATATIGRPNVGTNANPSVSLMNSQGFVTLNSLSGSAGDVMNFQALFIPTSAAQARLTLAMVTPGAPIAFDSVSVKQVTGYTYSKSTDWSSVVYAPIDSTRSVGCSDFGWSTGCSVMDVNGVVTPLPTTLPAGSEKLFLRLDSPWKM